MAKKSKTQKLEKGKEPTIDLGVTKATLLHDFDRFSNGSMVMRLADCDLRIVSGDKEVGSMGFAMGGCLYISVGDRLWQLDAMELFKQFMKAEQEQYLTAREPENT